jgi:hypothetical protein
MMMMMDIRNYYLVTPSPRYEYMRLPLSIIPDEIITKYNLRTISVGGWVYHAKACMASDKMPSWPTNYCSKDWTITATTLLDTPRDYSNIEQDQLHSHLLWVTLQSSTWENTIHTTCIMPYCVTVRSQQIGDAKSSGMISSVLVTFPCPAMTPQNIHNTHHTST